MIKWSTQWWYCRV